MNRYVPSCNFAKAHPQTAEIVMQYMTSQMRVTGCCRTDKNFSKDDCAIVNCQACREILQSSTTVLSIWEFLDAQNNLVLPDYSGLKVNVQDCWRDRNQPQVHHAVRSLLHKMNIKIIELRENKEHSQFCGSLHFLSKNPENQEKLSRYKDTPLYELPIDLETALMEEQVATYSCDTVVCYCNRCEKGITMGGGQAIHLMDLVFQQV